MWALWVLAVLSLRGCLCADKEHTDSGFHVAFRIDGSSVAPVNGLYICLSDAKCNQLSTHQWGLTSAENGDQYSLTSSNVLVGNQVQKRWYISRKTPSEVVTNLFGAIELAGLPDFALKTWKRLGESGAFEPNMTTTTMPTAGFALGVSTGSQAIVEADDREVLRLVESTNALLFLAEDSNFDAFSNRGRYITQSLYEHAVALEAYSLDSKHGDATLQSAAIRCDFAAVTGMVRRASECYSEVTIQLNAHIHTLRTSDDRTAVSLSMLRMVDANLSPLQGHVAETELRIRCHLYTLQLRQARHLLLHSLQPELALSILQKLQERVTAPFLLPWMALAECILGDCSDNTARLTSTDVRVACDDLLARLAVSKDASLVHTLYSQVCAAVQSSAQTDHGNTQQNIDHSRSIVASLLSVGATQAAVAHVWRLFELHGLLQDAFTTATRDKDYGGMFAALVGRQPSLALLFSASSSVSVPSMSGVLSSTNVQATLVLHSLLCTIISDAPAIEALLGDGDLSSLYLGAILQAATPVTLQSSVSADSNASVLVVPWVLEAVLLRYLLVDTLQILVQTCNDLGPGFCMLSDPVSNVGARGLFLLAYQGLGLLGEVLTVTEAALVTDNATPYRQHLATLRWVLNDATVPGLYAELVQFASPLAVSSLNTNSGQSKGTREGTNPSVMVTGDERSSTNLQDAARPSKIRVGFLSFFFRKHPVGRLLGPVIAGLDRDVFDVFIITSSTRSPTEDEITEYLHTHIGAEKWVYITHSLADAVARIRGLALDTLVYGDIFMDSFVAHLAMHRLATVQVAFWGHPFTSGYGPVDYFITADLFESTAVQSRHGQFSEQLVRFDSLSFKLYESPTAAAADEDVGGDTGLPASQPRMTSTAWDLCRTASKNKGGQGDSAVISVTNAFLAHRRRVLKWITTVGYTIDDAPVGVSELLVAFNHTTDDATPPSVATCALMDTMVAKVHLYGALQSLFKLHPLFDAAVVGILAADPHAVIIISRNGKQRVWEEHYRQRLQRAVTDHWSSWCQKKTGDGPHCDADGVQSALARIVFVNQMKHTAYAALLCAMDITLDTFPFGGGVTLSDALFGCAGGIVPFVTAGQLQSVHQIGAGMALRLNNSAMARAVAQTTEVLPVASLAGLLDGMTAVARRWAESAERYVAEAVKTAAMSHQRKLGTSDGQKQQEEQQSGEGNGGYDEQRRKISQELFRSNDSVREWSTFLQLIGQPKDA